MIGFLAHSDLVEKFPPNYTNAFANNFIMMPILFGALHFDPRYEPALLQSASCASLGFLLAVLRKRTGGIQASFVAQIVNSFTSSIIAGIALGYQMHLEKRKITNASN